MEELDSPNKPKFRYKWRISALVIALSVVGLSQLMIFSTPQRGPVVIIAFLALLFVIFCCLASLLIQLTLRLLGKLNISSIKLFYSAVILAIGGVFLVGLQTLRQLQSIDVVLVVLLEIFLLFYVLRRF